MAVPTKPGSHMVQFFYAASFFLIISYPNETQHAAHSLLGTPFTLIASPHHGAMSLRRSSQNIVAAYKLTAAHLIIYRHMFQCRV